MPTKAVNDRLRESKEFFKAKLEYDAPSVVTNIIDLPAKPYVGEVVNQSIEHTGGPAIYGLRGWKKEWLLLPSTATSDHTTWKRFSQ